MEKIRAIFYVFFLSASFIQSQYVYTQLGDVINFDTLQSPPKRILLNLGKDFQNTKQYSIWGWFKPNFRFPMITNIVTLKNLEGPDAFI